MSADVTRRAVLAGAVSMPWLVACSPGLDQPTGVDLEEGTFSSRFWPGRDVRWRLARPGNRDTGGAPQPLVVTLHGSGCDADWPFTGLHIERHVERTGLAVASVDGDDFN